MAKTTTPKIKATRIKRSPNFGGKRPGAGRPKGAVDEKLRKLSPASREKENIKRMLALGLEAKTILYQEFIDRVKKGDKLTVTEKRMMDKLNTALIDELDKNKGDDSQLNLPADEFLKKVWNDPAVDIALRIRAAEVVYKNANGGEKGKKEIKEEAAKLAGQGKFSPSRPPIGLVKLQ